MIEGTSIGEIRCGGDLELSGERHRYIWAACVDCGKERWVALRKGQPENLRCHKCAIKLFRGEHNSNWRGGRTKTSDGYIFIQLQPDNFFYPMANSEGRVLEHRLIMAKHLGRCLNTWEWVHHKNGVRNHNEYDNLEMTTAGNHMIAHSKGYRDGYTKGFADGKDKQIQEIKAQNDDLMKQIKLLQWQINKLGEIKVD